LRIRLGHNIASARVRLSLDITHGHDRLQRTTDAETAIGVLDFVLGYDCLITDESNSSALNLAFYRVGPVYDFVHNLATFITICG
jgi:hypothetical protein